MYDRKNFKYFVPKYYIKITLASPTINEEANANVSLHCRGTNSLIIKHTPGIYVIEQSVSADAWDVTIVVNVFCDY